MKDWHWLEMIGPDYPVDDCQPVRRLIYFLAEPHSADALAASIVNLKEREMGQECFDYQLGRRAPKLLNR
jgi:hypothetical protein